MDPCAFDNEKLVREDLPFQFRFYPHFNFRQASCTLKEFERDHGRIPESKAKLVDRVMQSIAREGMRNPLIIEWEQGRWMTTIGNNRWLALERLRVMGCEALVIYPLSEDTPPLSGHYITLRPLDALARFDATYPWWNSETMRMHFPTLVPKCI